VVAQRLARTLCASCRQPVTVPGELIRQAGVPFLEDEAEVHEAVGCARCGDTGYRGRLGLYEVMIVDEAIRGLIVERAPIEEITRAAIAGGMRRLREDGVAKVLAGRTTLAEVARVTGDAH